LHYNFSYFILIGLFFSAEVLNEELKQDLKVTVDELNSYLSSMRENANRQSEQLATLKQERAQMIQSMKEMEPLTELVQSQQSEITALRQVCVNSVIMFGIPSVDCRSVMYEIIFEVIWQTFKSKHIYKDVIDHS